MPLTPEEFVRLLQSIPSGIRQMNHSPALAQAATEVFKSVEKNFARQVDDNGVAWPPRKDNLPHPLLIKTGDMKDAATGGLGSQVRYNRDKAEIGIRGSVIPYAWRHQNGDEGRPQRKFFYLHQEEQQKVTYSFGERSAEDFRTFVIRRGR